MSFKLPEKKTIPEFEEDDLSYWNSNHIFAKSVEKNSKDNLYVFYDGPPLFQGCHITDTACFCG
jgi:isoleucyl-tRNA synthetase